MSEEMKNLNEQPEETPVEHVEPQAEAKKPLDKKTLGIIIGAAAAVVVVLAIVLIALLGGNKGPQGPVLNDYTLGMGVVVGTNASLNDKTGLYDAQVDATVATVVLDKDGKIVLCRIDAVQNKATLNADGTYDIKNLKTKMEKGDEYGMSAALGYGMDWNGDGVVKEWYEQAKAFEKHVIGMTAAEVEAMATQNVTNAYGEIYVISNDEDLLTAGCTIQITDFKAAVVKACNDEFKASFKSEGNFTLGVAANSADAYEEPKQGENPKLAMHSEFAASVIEDGKIVVSLNDAIQPNLEYDATGKPVGEYSFKATKRELKEEYGMTAAVNYGMDWNGDSKVLEWYEQSAAFSAHVVGMTGAEVEAMGTKEVTNAYGEVYVISNDDALLSAGCTIQITSIKAVVAESVANAR